jgi:NTP pyrophosphatase (non-canonical NTP hydrolase)
MGKLKNHYEEVVNKLWNAAERCETEKDHHMNAVLGLSGEAGEVADIEKKYWFHGKSDKNFRKEMCLELGDVLFYWLKVKDLWGLSLDEILEANKEKLYKRYADKLDE